MNENKQLILDKLCETLRLTAAAGTGNPLKELRYVKDGYDEYAIPVFEDGTGEPTATHPHGYYAVNISCDSGIAIVMDVVKQFVRKVW